MEEEFEIIPAISLYQILQYKGFVYLSRRWKRTALKLYSGGDTTPANRAYWWQWYKAVTMVMKHSGFWNEDEGRPMTLDEYKDTSTPRVPGEPAWKKLYPGSPAWQAHWVAYPQDRTSMMRYQYRVEKGLEKHASETEPTS